MKRKKHESLEDYKTRLNGEENDAGCDGGYPEPMNDDDEGSYEGSGLLQRNEAVIGSLPEEKIKFKHVGGEDGTYSGLQTEPLNKDQKLIALSTQVGILLASISKLKHGCHVNSDEYAILQTIELTAIGLGLMDAPEHHVVFPKGRTKKS